MLPALSRAESSRKDRSEQNQFFPGHLNKVRNIPVQSEEPGSQPWMHRATGSPEQWQAVTSPSLSPLLQLMEAIQKQEEINFRLQDYIDRIIVAIMETNPSILEVK